MQSIIESFLSRKKHEYAIVLYYFGLLFLASAMVIDFVSNFSFWFLLAIPLFVILARLYYQTIKNLFYTYWTFSILLVFYYLYYFFLGQHDSGLSQLFVVWSCLAFISKAFILSSPVFYPRVQWWEYDFRYRGDIKVMIEVEGEKIPGRLTDIRRGAGCVVSFKTFPLGAELIIHPKRDDIYLKGEIITKRETLVGRGYTYGLKFKFSDKNELKNFNQFTRDWKFKKKIQKRMKFNKVFK